MVNQPDKTSERCDLKKAWITALIIAVIAFIIQAIYIFETREDPAYRFPLIDSATYHQQALSILENKMDARPFWQPPAYPYFLALSYRIFGSGMVMNRFVHGGMMALACALIYLIGVRLTTKRAALAAALLTAFYGPLVYLFGQFLPTGLAIVLILLFLWMALKQGDRFLLWRATGMGLLFGLAVITVPTLALSLPVAMAMLLWPKADWRAVRRMALFLIMAALTVLPVTLRNRIVGGEWAVISTNGGINFYIGNNARTDVALTTRPGFDWERLERRPYLQGAKASTEADRYFYREALQWVRQHPGDFLLNMARKTRLFFHGREEPRNMDLYTMRDHSRLLKILVWPGPLCFFPFGVIIPLALLGMVIVWLKKEWGQRLVVMFILSYSFSVIVFFPTARYRAPVVPLLIIMAVMAVEWLIVQIRARAWRPAVLALVGMAIVFWGANSSVASPTARIRYDAELENAIGAALEIRGDHRSALGHFQRATGLDPTLAEALFNIGVIWQRQGRSAEAETQYREALRWRPDHDKARCNLAIILFQAGQYGEAEKEFQRALILNPLNALTRSNYGVALQAMGRKREANEEFRRAAELRSPRR